MIIIKGLLKENLDYYRRAENNIVKSIAGLPKGSIKNRKIGGKNYYYLQQRKGAKVVHKYLGKNEPKTLKAKLKERARLSGELKKIREAIRILNKARIGKRK